LDGETGNEYHLDMEGDVTPDSDEMGHIEHPELDLKLLKTRETILEREKAEKNKEKLTIEDEAKALEVGVGDVQEDVQAPNAFERDQAMQEDTFGETERVATENLIRPQKSLGGLAETTHFNPDAIDSGEREMLQLDNDRILESNYNGVDDALDPTNFIDPDLVVE